MKQLLYISLFLLFSTAFAEPVTEIIVPYAPGGATDVVARGIQQALIERANKDAIVVYKPGANGRIAEEYALHRPDSANTLLIIGTGTIFNQVLNKDLGYGFADFGVVELLARTPTVVVVNSQSNIYTLDDLIKASKSKPINCGISNPTTMFFGKYLFKQLNAPSIVMVPYKGSRDVATQLLGNHIDCGVEPMAIYAQFHKDHKLRIIAMGDTISDPDFSGIQLFSDYVRGAKFNSWYGIGIPNNSHATQDPEIVKIVQTIYTDKGFSSKLEDASLVVHAIPGHKFLDDEYQKYEKIRQLIGIEKGN